MLAPAFAASEVFVLHVHVRREARTISLSDLPLVVGLFFASPAALLLGRLGGTVAAYLLWRRQHPLKVVFNTTLLFIEIAVAVTAFRHFLGPPHIGMRAWFAAIASVCIASALTATLVTVVIAINESLSRLREAGAAALSSAQLTAAVSVGALMAVEAIAFDARAVLLAAGVLACAFLAFRAYASLSQRHLALERLYQFTRLLGASPEDNEQLCALLRKSKELLRAEQAEVVLLSAAPRWEAVRIRVDEQGRVSRELLRQDDPDRPVLERVTRGVTPLLGRRGDRSPATRAWLADAGFGRPLRRRCCARWVRTACSRSRTGSATS